MRAKHRSILAALLFFPCSFCIAATNGLDPRFGSGGVVIPGATASGQQMSAVRGIAVQDDGKILLAGSVPGNPPDSLTLPALGRLTERGEWDESFGDHGLFVLDVSNADATNGGILNRVVVQSEGSLVAAGGVYSQNVQNSRFDACTLLLRLTSGGMLDTSFGGQGSGTRCFEFPPGNSDGPIAGHADDIRLDADDFIYLSSPSFGTGGPLVARFSAAGVLDAAFGDAGVAWVPAGAYAWLGAIDANQSVLAVGSRHVSSSSSVIAAARFDHNGVRDPSYGTNGEADVDLLDGSDTLVNPIDAALDADNRLVIGDNNPPFGEAYRLVRLTSEGTLDATFNGAGQQPGLPGVAKLSLSGPEYDVLNLARPVSGNKLLIVGGARYDNVPSSPYAIALVRLNDDAGFDASYGDAVHPGWTTLDIAGGPSPTNSAYSMTLDAEGRALIGASFSNLDDFSFLCAGIIRIIPDALFNGAFDPAAPWPTCLQ